jgi:tetratricopeptide (TPR) repeat protein
MNSFNPEILALITRVPALVAIFLSGTLLLFSIYAHSATGTGVVTNAHYERADEIRQELRYLLAQSGRITPQMKELADEAVRELDMSIQMHPEYTAAYKLQITLYEDIVLADERNPSRINEIKAIIEQRTLRLAELDPGNPKHAMELYRLKSRSDPERESIIKNIIASYPGYAPAYRHYAQDLSYKGEAQEAIETYQKYLRLQYEQGETPHRDSIRELWKLLTEEQRKDEAIKMLDRYIDSGASPHAMVQVVEWLDFSDYPKSQYPELHDKIRRVKNYASYSDLEQAQQFLKNGQLTEAMESYRRQIEVNPHGMGAVKPFAEELEKQGHYREAYRVYEDLLDSGIPRVNKCLKLKKLDIRIDYLEPGSQLPEKAVKICNTWVTLM